MHNINNQLGNIGQSNETSEVATPTNSGKKKTYVVMVLDKSGSMMRGLQQTIDGFNEQIQTIRETETDDNITQVSLITFNHQVSKDIVNQSTDQIQELTESTYIPSGTTALYDGVGTAIDMLLDQDDINDDNTSVLMVILSDGDENASVKFKLEDVAEMIQKLKSTNRWTFTYMGANVDLSVISKTLNIDIGNIMTFDATLAAGYHDAKEMFKAGTTMYMSARSAEDGFVGASDFYSSTEASVDKTAN